MKPSNDLLKKALNTIRFLSADAIQKARSGHPGLPMGAAAMAYALWMRHLRFNPKNPSWPNRDRFILSGGHGSMLLYSLLYLTGYDLTLDDIEQFRQWNSRTPGHPECWRTPGVEVTTGPLGQGFGNGVGMAIAEANLAATFNRDGHNVIDHYTYVLASDGDLMEGVASEAASLAGHLRLGKLIVLYDNNQISIDGSTDLTFTEDVATRFRAYGWHVIEDINGHDVNAVDDAINKAKSEPRPSLLMCRTRIGYGLPTKEGTAKSHGEPPGEEELLGAKEKLGWPKEPMFYVPDDVLDHFRMALDRGATLESEWNERFNRYRKAFPKLSSELERRLAGRLSDDWELDIPVFASDSKGIATRVASGKTINALANRLTELIGGSADLTPSNKTWIEGSPSFQADSPTGRNIHFGIREHAMGTIVNGIAAHGGFIPYCATFLVFSDYMRPAIRVSALSRHHCIWLFTHDSIGLGEDGPTHQPIEQLMSLRTIPELVVIRPGDANEVAEAWHVAIKRNEGPTLISLTRQSVPIIDREQYAPASGLQNGAYVLAEYGSSPDLILMASGSEVQLIVEAGDKLAKDGINVRVISFPSWELFEMQDPKYKESVLPSKVTARLAVEAGVTLGWERWVGAKGKIIGIDTFGASAPYKILFKKFGFTVDNIIEQAKSLLKES